MIKHENHITKVLLLCCLTYTSNALSEISEHNYLQDITSEMMVLKPINVTLKNKPSQLLPSILVHTQIISEDQTIEHPSVIGMLQNSAGVTANGQSGRLQNFSIRGISRQRVMTQIAGMRIVTDRRAGTAANFLDPLLFDQIDIYRGAASTQFGSGALGGVVNISPRTFNRGHFSAGYDSAGDENHQMLGWGNQNTSLAISRRDTSNTHAANGDKLNTHYSQYSALINQKWQLADHDYNLLIIPTLAEDTGKPNSDFPGRVTNYPTEQHLLAKLEVTPLSSDWQAEFATHINTLDTQVIKPGTSKNDIENKAYDFSAKLFKAWQLSNIKGQSGFEYFGRRGVTSTEKTISFPALTTTRQTTLDKGEENEYALFNNIIWQLGPGELQAGLRYSYLTQSQRRTSTTVENIWSGNIGYLLPIGKQLEISGLFSTGFRMPSLSERFFSGTTGRGRVIGNPNLAPEHAYNFDLGIKHFGDNHLLSIHGFYNQVEDYIDRIETADDVFTFSNITSGEIYGVELENQIDIRDDMYFLWNATWIQGGDSDNRNLNDIPAHQAFFEYAYKPGNWQLGLQLRSFLKKNQTGPNEKTIPAANIFSASIGYEINQNMAIKFSAKNLFDENYNNSADRKAAGEPGRSFGFDIHTTL